jgi:hypothetical protein
VRGDFSELETSIDVASMAVLRTAVADFTRIRRASHQRWAVGTLGEILKQVAAFGEFKDKYAALVGKRAR